MNQAYKETLDYDRVMKVGDQVIVRWTGSHNFFAAPATITKINDKSVLAALNEDMDTLLGSYKKGKTIKVPRALVRGHSENNCVVTPETHENDINRNFDDSDCSPAGPV